jgi:hypothetical protein
MDVAVAKNLLEMALAAIVLIPVAIGAGMYLIGRK